MSRLFGAAVLALAVGSFIGCSSANLPSEPAAASNPDVVAIYGDNILTLDEFESRYERTVGSRSSAVDDSLSEYEDFLDRYVNFRLKVAAATSAGIPNSPEVLDEIRTYRTNLARPYLLEQEVMEPIVRELYDRQERLVDVSHILFRMPPSATGEDTLAAFERLQVIRDSVIQGVDFGDLALRHSEDPSATARQDAIGYRGRLGYFTAGRMIEPFESFAYETPVDSVSPVFRTQFGYHILYVHDQRDAIPEHRLSHIMMRPAPEDSASTMETMTDLVRRIRGGESFEDLAEEYSVDTQSKARGGDLGFIGFDAPIHSSFKDAAFEIGKIGAVSDVVQTPYGYHIIKVTDIRERQSFEEAYDELKQLASRLPRTQSAREDLARNIIADHAASVDTSFILNSFQDVRPDSLLAQLTDTSAVEDISGHPILVIGDSTYTIAEFADYAATSQRDLSGATRDRLMTILTGFTTESAIDFEAAQLEETDEEFARIMSEFRDGLVLFQFMEDSVWTAAEQDSSAIEQYFEDHKDEYWWQDRTRIISLNSNSDSLLTVLGKQLDSGTAIGEIYASFENDTLQTIRIDTMMVADSTASAYDRALNLTEGERTEPFRYRGSYMLLVNDGVEASRQKTFEEARTEIVGDYQAIVEDRLIERLRSEYNVRTYPSRLTNAFASRRVDNSVDEVANSE